MDNLSEWYQKFQSTHSLAFIAVCLACIFIPIVCVRTIRDKEGQLRKTWKKVLYCTIEIGILCFILYQYLRGPYQMKKEVDRQTLRCYEGEFEIVEFIPGYYDKAVFLVAGEEICLRYFTDDEDYVFEVTESGTYTGKLIYGRYIDEILFIEVYSKSIE